MSNEDLKYEMKYGADAEEAAKQEITAFHASTEEVPEDVKTTVAIADEETDDGPSIYTGHTTTPDGMHKLYVYAGKNGQLFAADHERVYTDLEVRLKSDA